MSIDWLKFVGAFFAVVLPMLPSLLAVFGAVFLLVAPLPQRGPTLFQRTDPWRRFKGAARRQVMSRAGGQCEGAVFL
ncbi:MAG: hypothetical protein LWW77_12875, partial [Propionibacteriales bacterium]|nr:hypothetical protein [Propionibacteriales bacterium]